MISVTDCPSHLQEPRSRRRLKAISASRYNENLRADSGDSKFRLVHEAEPYVVGAKKGCPHTCEIAINADQYPLRIMAAIRENSCTPGEVRR